MLPHSSRTSRLPTYTSHHDHAHPLLVHLLHFTHVYHHRQYARLRLQQSQQKPRPPRKRRTSPQSHIDRYHHRRLPLRWRRRHCSRHASDIRTHCSRQGMLHSLPSFLPPSSITHPSNTTTTLRTARNSTTSPHKSGARALARPPTQNSRRPSSPRTSNYTPSRPAANLAS